MPNVVGEPLSEAQALLEGAGVLVPSAIGYFGTWPITAKWENFPASLTADSTLVTADSLLSADGGGESALPPFTVTSQSPAAEDSVSANVPVTFWVIPPPLGVAFPAQNWSAF